MTDDSLGRLLLIVLAVIVLFPIVMMVIMLPAMGMWGGHGHMWNGTTWDGSLWPWLLGWLLGLLILVGLGALLYRAIGATEGTDQAIRELRRAYARGDLTDEEFETRRERLERDR